MLKIFYGRENVDKEGFVLEELKKAGRGLLIVPDQFTLDAERALFDRLQVKAIMDIEVMSMSRLGYRLLEELGGRKRTFIDKYGRHMLLSQIAREKKGDLTVFRGLEEKNSFIDMVNNFISELKQFNCGAPELETICESLDEESYLHKKLSDILTIYTSYEERIRGKYTDSEDYIDLFLGKIGKSRLIRDNNVWIYGFDSFAPKALSVIGEMMTYAENVNVVLTYTEKAARDEELFRLTAIVKEKLEAAAKSRGIETLETEMNPRDWPLKKAQELSFLEHELFALPARKYTPAERDAGSEGGNDTESDDGNKSVNSKSEESNITLVAAANLYNEAESAAAYVLHLVRDLGYRYGDIKVICNDQDQRGPILKRTFGEYGMELMSDSSKDILQSPVVRYVLAMMDVAIENFRTDLVLKVLKSGFGNISEEEITELDNYSFKFRIKGGMWKKPFLKGATLYGEERLKAIDAMREKAVAPMLRFKELFKAKTVDVFIGELYNFLYTEEKIPQKIEYFMKEQSDGGRNDLAEETGQIWGKIVGILDQMSEVMGGCKLNPREFRELFAMGISQVKIGVLPQSEDSLAMGTMQRTRTSAYKVLVVVGVNEGIMPREKPSASLIAGEEKDFFKEKGIEICKVDSVRLLEEKMGIYRNISKPSERLWMSYSTADLDGKSIKPSEIFGKIKEIFPECSVKKDILNADDDLMLINGQVSGTRHLVEALQRAGEGQPLGDEFEKALDWYRENRPELLDSLSNAFSFDNKQEELGRELCEKLFSKGTGKDLSFSPSQVEKFANCPFNHFISYGLKPDERRIFQIDPRGIGDVYHRTLMMLSQSLTAEGTEITDPSSPWMTITKEECAKMVDDIVGREVAGYKEGLFKQGREGEYRSKRLSEVCRTACWALIEQVRAGRIIASDYEVNFGRDQKIEPIEIELKKGGKYEKIYIEGIIDRVDYLDGDLVKIVDYKTGNLDLKIEKIKSGHMLQLMTYLIAAEEKKRCPAAVFYFKIKEPEVNLTGKELSEDDIKEIIIKDYRLDGVLLDDPKAISAMTGEFEKDSPYVNLKNRWNSQNQRPVLSMEEFKELEDQVRSKLDEICKDMLNGKIDISPMKEDKKTTCDFCEYRGICRFDRVFAGCRYRPTMKK